MDPHPPSLEDMITPAARTPRLLVAAALLALTPLVGCVAPPSAAPTPGQAAPAEQAPRDDRVPAEHRAALKKAQTYADTMHLSKAGIFHQLTSEYGEKFPEDAAQYAVDNVKADWNANALAKAKTYQEMGMSNDAIREQLASEHGERFTEAEADYAVSNL